MAYKNKELAQRANALAGNCDMEKVHNVLTNSGNLRVEIENKSQVRVAPDQFNYRSPKKYTAISTYVKDLQKSRIFALDGKMSLCRKNIQ